MNLNNREKAWQQRKRVYKESHPTYAQWGKYAGSLEDRMKTIKPLLAYSKERADFEKKFYKEHGNGWWIFQGTTLRHNIKPSWIEQFRVEDPTRIRGKGAYTNARKNKRSI